jgi:hypothetical protein
VTSRRRLERVVFNIEHFNSITKITDAATRRIVQLRTPLSVCDSVALGHCTAGAVLLGDGAGCGRMSRRAGGYVVRGRHQTVPQMRSLQRICGQCRNQCRRIQGYPRLHRPARHDVPIGEKWPLGADPYKMFTSLPLS